MKNIEAGGTLDLADDVAVRRHTEACTESALKILEKTYPSIGDKSLAEASSDEPSRRALLRNISREDFLDFIISFNGSVRGLPPGEWSVDGKDVVIGSPENPSWDFPEQEDKTVLLQKMLEAMKQMEHDNRDLREIGMLSSCVLTAIHLFNDGNGRTARFLLAWIIKGTSAQEIPLLKKTLLSREFSNGTNASIIQGAITACIERSIGKLKGDQRFRFSSQGTAKDLTFRTPIPEELQHKFTRAMRRSSLFLHRALFIHTKDHLDDYLKDEGEVDANDVIADLNEEKLRAVLNTWKEQKTKQVEVMIDCFVHPNKPDYQVEVGRPAEKKKMSILEYYKMRIASSTDPALHEEIFG